MKLHPNCENQQAFVLDFITTRSAFWSLFTPFAIADGLVLSFLKGGYVVAVVLSDKDFKTVNSALLHALLELSFLHGLHVTDLPDVEFTFDLDCSETTKLINEAISVLDKFS